MAVHYSSVKMDWTTPRAFFDTLNDEFRFDLDAAASAENALCERYFTEQDDALTRAWTGTIWCNPPYGRGIGAWIEKAYDAAQEGATVVMLIPARTDTKAWHKFIFPNPYATVRFVPGRLKFGTAINSAPFPCAVIVFRPGGAT